MPVLRCQPRQQLDAHTAATTTAVVCSIAKAIHSIWASLPKQSPGRNRSNPACTTPLHPSQPHAHSQNRARPISPHTTPAAHCRCKDYLCWRCQLLLCRHPADHHCFAIIAAHELHFSAVHAVHQTATLPVQLSVPKKKATMGCVYGACS